MPRTWEKRQAAKANEAAPEETRMQPARANALNHRGTAPLERGDVQGELPPMAQVDKIQRLRLHVPLVLRPLMLKPLLLRPVLLKPLKPLQLKSPRCEVAGLWLLAAGCCPLAPVSVLASRFWLLSPGF